jgi:hypothetical protein
MNRISLFGVATVALAAAAPAIAQDSADTERAFARAARSYTACLATAATSLGPQDSLSARCLAQETAYRESSMRLRMARGASEAAAASETEAEIADGLRIFGTVQTRRLASASE